VKQDVELSNDPAGAAQTSSLSLSRNALDLVTMHQLDLMNDTKPDIHQDVIRFCRRHRDGKLHVHLRHSKEIRLH